MKRFFPLMLSLCFLFTIAPVAYAADDLSVPEISVSKNARVTSSIGTEYEYISIIDKEAGTAQAVQKNLLTGEYTYGPVVAFSSVGSADALDEAAVTRASPTYHQDTFSNIEYDIWVRSNETEWLLQRPQDDVKQYYFRTLEVAKNETELGNFKISVDALNDYEFKLIADVGTAIFDVAMALCTSYAALHTYGMLTTEALVQVEQAIFSSYDAVVSMRTFGTYFNTAAAAYFDVFDVSDVFYDD